VPGSVGGARFGLRNGLVVIQVATCTVLLICMGLFLRSLHTARSIDLGLTSRNLILLAFDPALDQRSDAESRLLLREIVERAQRVAGAGDRPHAVQVLGLPLLDDLRLAVSSRGSRLRDVTADCLAKARHRVATAASDLRSGAERVASERRAHMQHLASRLNDLSPLATLARGYALARDGNGRTLTSAAAFGRGMAFELLLRDGAVHARSEGHETAAESPDRRNDP
jgi:exonuclease VII large subunit